MRGSFVFYRSFFEALKALNSEQQGKCYAALAAYALDGTVPDNSDPIVCMFFTMARAQIDANNQRYENGIKGGRPKNQTLTKQKPNINQNTQEQQQTKTEVKANVNVNDNVNVKEKDTLASIKKEKNTFTPPTIEQVNAYVTEKGLVVDAKKFIDYFEEGNWIDSEGKKVKNWKQKLITWDSNGRTERTLQAVKTLFPRPTGVKSETYGGDIPL